MLPQIAFQRRPRGHFPPGALQALEFMRTTGKTRAPKSKNRPERQARAVLKALTKR
jgi:hypothetical protein